MEKLKREGVKKLFFVKFPTEEKCRFTVPPAVALLNYISCGILWRIFCQTGILAGFHLLIINFAVYLCIFTQCVFNMHVCNNQFKYKKRRKRRGRI
jgi:hypothetical protein